MATKPRTRRRKAAPLPETTDPVEIAMAEEAKDSAPDSPARALLANQNRLVLAEVARLDRLRWRDYVLTALGVFLLAIAIVFVWSAARSQAVVVEPFDTPPAFAEQGLTGQVLAASVQDSIATIQAVNVDAAMDRNVGNAWADEIAVEVPSTGISVGEMDRLLRRRLGRETHVGGSVVRHPDGTLSLTIRATGVPPKTFTGPEVSLAAITAQAAEYVYGRFEPRLYARYLIRQNRLEDALAFIEPAYGRAPEDVRSALASSWASVLNLQGRGAESIAKDRLAIELDPENWIAASNLIGTLTEVEGEESAAREGRRLQQRVAMARDKPPAWLDPLQNYRPLVEDWSGLIEGQMRASAATAGRGSIVTGDINTYLADAEAYRHDWASAERYLLAGPSDTPDFLAQRLLNEGMHALESGDLPRATAALERFGALLESDPSLQWSFSYHTCFLGLAYGRAGRVEDAEAVFASAGDFALCRAFHADVLEASGARSAADRAYAAAAELAPSLPRPYQHWGAALLARGDLAGARTKFAAAHARGPAWADPLKSLGDVAMRQGQWKKAAEYYEQATEFAPGWRDLAAARRAADGKVATLPWWKRWFA